ncbi:MAG TPA: hypothetical protein VF316_01285 [Polyangiaceae bacterium]
MDANVGPSKTLPIDGVIELSFDRFLNPSTVTRQSVSLRDEFNQAPITPVVAYDPVRRVVTVANPSTDGKPWLLPGQPYKLILPIPAKVSDFGLRAIDDAGLEGKGAVVIGFYTTPATGRQPDSTVAFCTDVLPILASCGSCHLAPDAGAPISAPAGLVLDTGEGIAFARSRVANASNTGPRSGAGRPAGNFFPVDMPLIDPGNPGNSFLLYKLLLTPPPSDGRPEKSCTPSPYLLPETNVASGLADGERSRLGDYVLGLPMPASGAGLDETQLERLRLWIAQGANVESCPATPSPPDCGH